ncbi:MAG: RNA polymerase sigma factor [Bacteroidota bacterium]
MRNSEEDSMQAVKDGDIQAIAKLYERYRQPLMGYFYRRTGGEESLSQDLVQAVFMRVLRYRTSYRAGAALRPWLFQMARNVLYDEWQSQQPMANTVSVEQVELVQRDIRIDQQIEKQERESYLRQALQQLPEESQELIELCKYQALPYREVGQMLGISEGNVKVRLHRAVKRLGQVYRKLNPEASEV